MWLWLSGALLLLTGVGGVWYTVTRTDYLPKLAWWLVQQVLPIILKRMTPEKEAEFRKTIAEGKQWDFSKKQPKEWGH